MASNTLNVGITYENDDLPTAALVQAVGGERMLFRTGEYLCALAGGVRIGSVTFSTNDVAATGTLTLSGASGTVGGTINGVTVTVTAAGGDAATAGLIAAAINASANPLVSQFVTASAAGAVVTLTAKMAGPSGNAVTLAASGTGVTASGARLTGGASTPFTISK